MVKSAVLAVERLRLDKKKHPLACSAGIPFLAAPRGALISCRNYSSSYSVKPPSTVTSEPVI